VPNIFKEMDSWGELGKLGMVCRTLRCVPWDVNSWELVTLGAQSKFVVQQAFWEEWSSYDREICNLRDRLHRWMNRLHCSRIAGNSNKHGETGQVRAAFSEASFAMHNRQERLRPFIDFLWRRQYHHLLWGAALFSMETLSECEESSPASIYSYITKTKGTDIRLALLRGNSARSRKAQGIGEPSLYEQINYFAYPLDDKIRIV
jgi:hypothetical protein